MSHATKENLMLALQYASITSACAAAMLNIYSEAAAPYLAPYAPLGNFGAFMLLTCSGWVFDLMSNNTIRPERILAFLGLLFATSITLLKLQQTSFANAYPSLETLGLGLTMMNFGLLRQEAQDSPSLMHANGRRKLCAYVISSLGISIQIISAMGLKQTELNQWIPYLILTTINTVIIADLHKILPMAQLRKTHYAALASLVAGMLSMIGLSTHLPIYPAALSLCIGLFAIMQTLFTQELLHPTESTEKRPASTESSVFKTAGLYCRWLVPYSSSHSINQELSQDLII